MPPSSPPLSAHRIGVPMSPAGRFLKCKDCLVCFDFPDGEQYNAVAGQFESHLCGSQAQRVSRAGRDRSLVFLRYQARVPVMASCAKCNLRFFTLTKVSRDRFGADEYLLRHNFHEHECEESRLASGPNPIALTKSEIEACQSSSPDTPASLSNASWERGRGARDCAHTVRPGFPE